MNTKSLSDRILEYERCSSITLPNNTPIILRIDGRAFHTFTKRFKKPFDDDFMDMMNVIGLKICEEISGARIAYLQSDEISILIYNNIAAESWFGNRMQKMTSVSASLASAIATQWLIEHDIKSKPITFDSRVFALPEKEICNYFIWRQQDWIRNSLQMLSRSHFSHKELQNKNSSNMHSMLHEKKADWYGLPQHWKYGRTIYKTSLRLATPDKSLWELDLEPPIFAEDRLHIDSVIDEVNYEDLRIKKSRMKNNE